MELNSFPRYYWQVFGRQDKFDVEVSSNGIIKKYSLHAVSVMEGYEAKRTEMAGNGRKLRFLKASACLRPGGFGGDEEKYRAFIDSAFLEIKARQTSHLVIDLRYNPGGDNAFSDYQGAYIAPKPFKWNSSFSLKSSNFLKEHARKNSDTTEVYWQGVLSQEDGEIHDFDFAEYQHLWP